MSPIQNNKISVFFPEGLIVNKAPSAYATRSTSILILYIPRTVSLWNSLPEQITRSTTSTLS